MKKLFPSIACCLILFSLSTLLYSQSFYRNSLAVLDMDTRSTLSQEQIGLVTDRLCSRLASTNRINVLERGNIEYILRQAGWQQTVCTSTECMVEAGNTLNVELVVGGSLVKVGQLYILDVVLIDVKRARVIQSITREYRGAMAGLLDLMGSIAEQISAFVKTNTGSLSVATDPVPATIFVNNNKLGESPQTVDNLLAGEYTIRLVAEGYAPFEDRITIEPAQLTEYTATLKRLLTVTIESIPSEADLFVNNIQVGKTPYSKEYAPLTRLDIIIKKENYQEWTQAALVTRDTTIIAILDLYGGSLAVTTTPPQAEVFLDDQRLGFSPLRRDNIAAGAHVLKISKPGYRDYTESITFKNGEVKEVNFRLDKKTGTLVVKSTPEGAGVAIDGVPRGQTPLILYDVERGTHTVTISKKNYYPCEEKVPLVSDASLILIVNLMPSKSGCLLGFLTPVNIGIGSRLTNDKVTNYWAMMPTLSGHISFGHLLVILEGMKGDCLSDIGISGRTFYTRVSAVPMIKVQWKIFYAAVGAGMSKVYQTDEYWDKQSKFHVLSTTGLRKTAKGLAGISLPISSRTDFWLEGGGTVMSWHKYGANIGAGFSYVLAQGNHQRYSLSGRLKHKNFLTNSLIGAGFLATAAGHFYQVRSVQTYREYFREPNHYAVQARHRKTLNYDKKAKNCFGIALGLVVTGLLNHYLISK